MASSEAWAQGWELGSKLAGEQRARKQAYSDEEFKTHFGELQQDIGNLQKKLSTISPGSPESLKTQYALQQAIESRNGLFAKTPGALQKFGHLLHLTKGSKQPEVAQPVIGQPTMEVEGKKVPTGPSYMIQGPQTPAQLKAQAEAKRMAAAAPGYVAPQTSWEQYVANWKQVMGPQSEPSEDVKQEFARTGKVTQEKPSGENFKTQALLLPDGTTLTAQQDTKSGKWQYLTGEPIPTDVLRDAKMAPKEAQPKTAWARNEKGRIYSVNLDARTHQAIQGTENYDLVPPASLTGRITTGFYHYTDPNGNLIQVPETHTSVPVGAGTRGTAAPSSVPPSTGAVPAAAPVSSATAAAPVVPKTPAEARKQAQQKAAIRPAAAKASPSAAPVAPKTPKTAAQPGAPAAAPGGGRVIGWKGSKDYIDTKTAYEAAIDRTKTMDDNLKEGLRGDQQAMLSLVANHIGMTLGAQKGARINQAVWNEAVQSAKWLQSYYSKAFHTDPKTGEMVFDGWKRGVTLTDDQMRSMVNLAHEKVHVLKQHLNRLDVERGIGAKTTPSGGGKSLADRLNDALGGK